MAETPSIQTLARQVYFSPMQRQKIERSIAHNEHLLSSPDMRGAIHVAPDTELLTFNIDRDKAMLAAGVSPEYDHTTRNKLHALGGAIIDRIAADEDFLTHDEMERPFQSNVTRLRRFESRNKKHILALKTIRRILDPLNDDPDFTSIAQFRKDTMPLGNPRKYWTGFDNVQWTESVEDTLAAQIPGDVYARFLELKMLNWSRSTIMRELSMSVKIFNACQARLLQSQGQSQEQETEETETARGDDFVPEPTPPRDRTGTPEDVAARAVGVPRVPVKEDKPRNWPFSELTPLGVTVDAFVALAHFDKLKLYAKAREKRFTRSEMKRINAALDQLRAQPAQTVVKPLLSELLSKKPSVLESESAATTDPFMPVPG